MVLYALETDHLGVDADGWVYKKRPGRAPIGLGPIARGPGVRPQYAAELEQLVEWWEDRRDEKREWRETYRRQAGV